MNLIRTISINRSQIVCTAVAAVIAIYTVFSLAGCSPSDNTQTEASSITQTTAAETTAAPTTVPPETQPSAADPEESDAFVMPAAGTRPFAVMIDNEGSMSYPQGGLNKAQIVYEMLVEGGETRIMPLYWGTAPEMIGPVRSSRHYFLDYVLEHDALYVHFGWSPMAQKDIGLLKINNINGVGYGGEVFWDLTADKRNWQDSYTSVTNLNELLAKSKYRTVTDRQPVFSYLQTGTSPDPDSGTDARTIRITYSKWYSCGYEYDMSAERYIRIRNRTPHIDRSVWEPLTTKNIIIQFVSNSLIKGDKKGRQDLKTVGTGNGYHIVSGKSFPIKWTKKDRSSPTVYTYENGEPLLLARGATWIQMVPLYSDVFIGVGED